MSMKLLFIILLYRKLNNWSNFRLTLQKTLECKAKALLILVFASGRIFAAMSDTLILDNFDKMIQNNLLGKKTGVWVSDASAGLQTSFVSSEYGHSLCIDYDISEQKSSFSPIQDKVSTQYSYNLPFQTLAVYHTGIESDLKKYKYMVISIRGDKNKGFSRTLPVELRDSSWRSFKYIMEGITEKWQKFMIPLDLFQYTDMAKLQDLIFVFDQTLTRKTGCFYFDDIIFVKILPEEKDLVLGKENNLPSVANLTRKTNLAYGKVKDNNDLSATVRLWYENNYLNFFTVVNDNEVIFSKDTDKESDRVTVVIDLNGDGYSFNGKDDIEAIFSPNGIVHFRYGENSDVLSDEKAFVCSAKYKRKKYEINFKLNTEFINLDKDKKSIYVGFLIDDVDRDKKAGLSWGYSPRPKQIKLGEISIQ